MPWKAATPVESRLDFVHAVKRAEVSMAELCRRFGVSRQNGYKWLQRYEESGLAGLELRSRAPNTSPRSMTSEVRELVLAARKRFPHWGPRKLRAILSRRHPLILLPATSTIGVLLEREGLVQPRKLRPKTPPYEHPFLAYVHPNDVWCIDFKGQFRLQNGEYCYPLTVTDGVSRYLLGCRAFPGIHEAPAMKAMERLFREYGLPFAIRSDNGTPFASTLAICGLSRLAIWFVRLGIRPERIDPGKPQQNGRHERMHRTLKAETTHPPASNQRAQQAVFDRFRREFNELRPHEALGLKCPAEVYTPSIRPFPRKLAPLEYPSWNQVRLVDCNGCISLRYASVFLGRTLVGEHVGLEPVADGVWLVRLGSLEIGRIDERLMRMEKVPVRWVEGRAA